MYELLTLLVGSSCVKPPFQRRVDVSWDNPERDLRARSTSVGDPFRIPSREHGRTHALRVRACVRVSQCLSQCLLRRSCRFQAIKVVLPPSPLLTFPDWMLLCAVDVAALSDAMLHALLWWIEEYSQSAAFAPRNGKSQEALSRRNRWRVRRQLKSFSRLLRPQLRNRSCFSAS